MQTPFLTDGSQSAVFLNYCDTNMFVCYPICVLCVICVILSGRVLPAQLSQPVELATDHSCAPSNLIRQQEECVYQESWLLHRVPNFQRCLPQYLNIYLQIILLQRQNGSECNSSRIKKENIFGRLQTKVNTAMSVFIQRFIVLDHQLDWC